MLDTIARRRSIRFYRNDPVSDQVISQIIQAGFYAPSAHGKHPWHVVVIRDDQRKKHLASLHKWTKHIGFAPAALVVCADKREMEQFWIEDASAFLTTMLLEATNQGLGGCWIAVRGVVADGTDVEAKVKEICNIPDYIGVLAVTPLGYPARNPGPHASQIPEGRVHQEVFE